MTDEERALTFDDLGEGGSEFVIARDILRNALDERRGLITLTGKPGRGKSTLLICAINEARKAGLFAIYTTVPDLLQTLRAAYSSDDPNDSFDARWDAFVRADVLALDELDEYHATSWANERFLRLVDERWRATPRRVTVMATNSTNLNTLPEKIASRLRDGRGQIVELHGQDWRPRLAW